MLGLVDALAEVGIEAFGPSREAARLEGSKRFAKEMMEAVGVPTAGYAVLATRGEALEAIAAHRCPIVLKADALAAGKGVIICPDERAARDAVDAFFTERRFGDTEVVLEEFLEGEELSLLAVCDGERAVPMAPAQDYKRIFDGDRGPNTGGMGSYSPVPGHRPRARRRAGAGGAPADRGRDEAPRHAFPRRPLRGADDDRRRARRCWSTTAASATPRPRRCSAGCARTCSSCSRARLAPGAWRHVELEWSDEWAVTVVLASRGYPESSSKGRRDPRAAVDRLDRGRGASRRHRRGGRPGRDRRRAGAQRDRDRGDPGRGPRRTPTPPPSGSSSTASRCVRDIAARAVDRVEA